MDTAAGFARRARDELLALRALGKAGFFERSSPRVGIATVRAMRSRGSLGSAIHVAALRHPDRPGVIDELGSLTYAELDDRSDAVAAGLRARGVRAGDGVAILARNHRGFYDAVFAVFKLGARAVLLNTDFAGPQVRAVADREGTRLLICDEEYEPFVEGFEPDFGRLVAWSEEARDDSLDMLVRTHSGCGLPPVPARHASLVILTSGTTGSPKGANRQDTRSLTLPGAVMERTRLAPADTTVIAAPLFHSLGFMHAILAIGTSSTVVLRRRFDPDGALDDIACHRATGLILVPIMLQRIVEAQEGRNRDVGSLRTVFVAGSQLGASLAVRAQDALGDVVHNLYGSTEVAFATMATPEDLRDAPDSVGRPMLAARLKLYDADDREISEPGVTGRIFVANSIPFEGYTGGGGKQIIEGLLSSGDMGHLDASGRLFIDGRDDAMIVSGGENVFPDEVEELLNTHPRIDEAAVVGVDDEKFGQRLRAFVVRVDGAEVTEEDVTGFVRENLARFKVPREVVFIDELPRNPTGKVLKRDLAATET